MSVGNQAVLNDFTNKVAHAIAGCAAGAARTDTSGGRSAGAIGAAVGELAAEAYGKKADTTQFAAMVAAVAAAAMGRKRRRDQSGESGRGECSSENCVSHSPFASVRTLVAKENARLIAACGADCSKADFARIDAQMQKVEAATQLLESQKHTALTTEQAMFLGENIAALLPVYGTLIALYQAITGESLSGNELTTIERLLNGVAAARPVGVAAYRALANSIADTQWAITQNGFAERGI